MAYTILLAGDEVESLGRPGWFVVWVADRRMALGSLVARVMYYPTLFLNAAVNTAFGDRWYNRIDEHVILGALPMPFMTQELVKENVKGVIALNEEYELRHFYNTENEWQKYGIKTLNIPTQDLFAAPSLANLKSAVDFIECIKSENGSVYVHCKAGKTRSTTVVMCYLMKNRLLHPNDAFNIIKAKRPQIWLRQPQIKCIREYYDQEVRTARRAAKKTAPDHQRDTKQQTTSSKLSNDPNKTQQHARSGWSDANRFNS